MLGEVDSVSRHFGTWVTTNHFNRNADARRGGLGNSPLFPTGTPPPVFFPKQIPILTCIKIADNALELLLGSAPTLLDLRPFVASQVHIDFTLAAK